MESVVPPKGGFSFDLTRRNMMIESTGAKAPKAVKTGTTIAGIIFKGGVMLGADTRATEGPTVADKNCEKIHYIAPNIYCCGAGTAADTENVTNMISSNLELHSLTTGRTSRVVTALTMLKQYLFRYQGHVSAALVLGGVDVDGPHLFTIYPHGSTDKLPYVTMGSGSLAAMAVFEAGWKEGLDFEEAKELVANAIKAGIFNDLGSGSNVDLTAIMLDGTVHKFRNYYTPNPKPPLQQEYHYKKGTTAILSESFKPHHKAVQVVIPAPMEI